MKKKILFIIDELKIGGGAGRFFSLITSKLQEKYFVNVLTFFEFKNTYSSKAKHYSLKENIGFFNKIICTLKINELIRIIRIQKFINTISPNIIVSITDFANIPTILAKFLFRIKIPLILSIRCNPKMQYKKKNRHVNFLIKILYRLNLVNKIISVSRELQCILERDYNIKREKLTTIYNGIGLEKIEELKEDTISEYKEIFNNENTIKFITVGRLRKEKGHKLLIEAFSKFKKEIINSKLIIIGHGPLRHKLELLIKKKDLEKDILLLGIKENPFKYLAKSDVFVLSSKHEGFPNVLLEALACGLPIISTNCETGPKEILDDGKYGILVNVMDSEDLAEKMIYLAKNPELLNNYSKKSLERAKHYDLRKSANEWINVIDSYLNI